MERYLSVFPSYWQIPHIIFLCRACEPLLCYCILLLFSWMRHLDLIHFGINAETMNPLVIL
jgi:hypothetical protein